MDLLILIIIIVWITISTLLLKPTPNIKRFLHKKKIFISLFVTLLGSFTGVIGAIYCTGKYDEFRDKQFTITLLENSKSEIKAKLHIIGTTAINTSINDFKGQNVNNLINIFKINQDIDIPLTKEILRKDVVLKTTSPIIMDKLIIDVIRCEYHYNGTIIKFKEDNNDEWWFRFLINYLKDLYFLHETIDLGLSVLKGEISQKDIPNKLKNSPRRHDLIDHNDILNK